MYRDRVVYGDILYYGVWDASRRREEAVWWANAIKNALETLIFPLPDFAGRENRRRVSRVPRIDDVIAAVDREQ